jgi:metal-sulfur cluster biosynthetic enzyme
MSIGADQSDDAAARDQIRRVLDEIKDPCSVAASVPMGLDEMGLVKSVDISPTGRVDIELRLTSPFCEMIAFLRNETLRRVGELPGVTEVCVRQDSGLDRDPEMIAPDARARRRRRLQRLHDLPMAGGGLR